MRVAIEVKWAAVECRPRSFRGLLEAAVKREYAFVTATSASCERLEIGRAAVTLRGMKRTASDAPLSWFFISRYRAPRHVTFRKRSHSSEGSRARLFRGKPSAFRSALCVGRPQTPSSRKSLILQFLRQL